MIIRIEGLRIKRQGARPETCFNGLEFIKKKLNRKDRNGFAMNAKFYGCFISILLAHPRPIKSKTISVLLSANKYR